MSEQQPDRSAEEGNGDELRSLHRLLHVRVLEPGGGSERDARQRDEASVRLGALQRCNQWVVR